MTAAWKSLPSPKQLRSAGEELQIPRLSPDFLSSLVGSANFMRLSSTKAAHVAISSAA
jgi:hypothetical protein